MNSPHQMAYITCWDSFTNDVHQEYISVNPNQEKMAFADSVHASYRDTVGEEDNDWEVKSCVEWPNGLYVITLLSKTGQDISTYMVRLAP